MQRRRSHLIASFIAGTLLGASGLAAGAAPATAAALPEGCPGWNTTCTITVSAGSQKTWKVPTGAKDIVLVVSGGDGGMMWRSNGSAQFGGAGGTIKGTVNEGSIKAGDTLALFAGADGSSTLERNPGAGAPGAGDGGATGGAGNSRGGGGGGGGSFVFHHNGSAWSPLLVAGGGGGAGTSAGGAGGGEDLAGSTGSASTGFAGDGQAGFGGGATGAGGGGAAGAGASPGAGGGGPASVTGTASSPRLNYGGAASAGNGGAAGTSGSGGFGGGGGGGGFYGGGGGGGGGFSDNSKVSTASAKDPGSGGRIVLTFTVRGLEVSTANVTGAYTGAQTRLSASLACVDSSLTVPAGTLTFTTSGGTNLGTVAVAAGQTTAATTWTATDGTTTITATFTATSATNSCSAGRSTFTVTAARPVVAFYRGPDTGVMLVAVDYGTPVAEPDPAPKRTGYTFDQWETTEEKAYDFATPVTANIDLLATWTVNSYQVTFDANGGTPAPEPATVKYNTTVTEPTVSRVGHSLDGWYTASGTGAKWDFADPMGAADMALQAKWIPNTYTASFDAAGGSAVADQTVAYGTTLDAAAPNASARTGYTLQGWYTTDGKKWDFAADTMGAENLSLTARWTATPYTVTFNPDGGTPSPAAQDVAYDAKVTKPADPGKGGWVFVGWFTASDHPWDFTTDLMGREGAADMELTARWLEQVDVTFDTAGGSAVVPAAVGKGDPVPRPVDPTRTGYTFVQWEAVSGTAYDFDTPVTADLTLTAVWRINQYTLTFDSDGGSAVPAQTVDYNTPFAQPPEPTKAGADFQEWRTTAGVAYDFASPATGDLTLTAVWREYTLAVFSTALLGDAAVLTPYTFPVEATGFPAPTLTAVGLPAGLTMSPSGLITGTPTTIGSYPVTVTATNAAGATTKDYVLEVVTPATPPQIRTAALGEAVVGLPYSDTIVGDGAPYPTFTATGLPPGISLSPWGALSGTPGAAGEFTVTVTGTNPVGAVSKVYTLTVREEPVPPTISVPGDSAGTVLAGDQIDIQLPGGGAPAPTYTATGLPPGVELTPDGRIVGTPTEPGDYPVTVTLTGADGQVTTVTITITVAADPAAPSFTSSDRVTMNAGASLTFEIQTTGAPSATVTALALPDWVQLVDYRNGVALLTVTPRGEHAGDTQLALTATNASGSALQTFTITVRDREPVPGTVPVLDGPLTGVPIQVERGGTITATAEGLEPGTIAQFVLYSAPTPVGEVTVAADGTATLTFPVPASVALGEHTVVMVGIGDSGERTTLGAPTTVVAGENLPPGKGRPGHRTPLPDMGVEPGLGLALAGLTMGLGGALILMRRRRA